MAPLTMPRWEAIPQPARELWKTLGRIPAVGSFYLAGGTALAVRLGHRVSLDLDLFADIEALDDDLRRSIVDALSQGRSIDLKQDSNLGLVVEVDGVMTSFFTYGYSLLSPADAVDGLQVANVLDVGLMKLDAIAGRGMRKDFYDVYFIARQIPLEVLFERSADKYPRSHSFGMRVLAALVDFDIADQQDEPTLLLPAEWDQVKKFFTDEAHRLGQKWFAHRR